MVEALKMCQIIPFTETTGEPMKKSLLISILATILVTACAAQPAQPTLSAEDQNAIAVAVAMTTIAENSVAVENAPVTVAEAPAIPTEPVVMVSVDNPTAMPNVTDGLALQTTPESVVDPCDKILKTSEAGPLTNVRFKNKTGGQVSLGVFLWKENAYGQCGYVVGNPISIAKNQSRSLSLPQGAYFAWAWVTFENGETSSPHGNFFNSESSDPNLSASARPTMEVIIKRLEIIPG